MRSRTIQPPYCFLANNTTIHPYDEACVGPEIIGLDNGIATGVWTANLLAFIPLILREPLLVAQFFWHNGIAVDGNTDVGIYNESGGAKLGSSGSTLNAGTSALQIVDVTNFYIPANVRLWLALGCDSSVQQFFRSVAPVVDQDYIGIKQQASGWSSGLPTSATLAIPTIAVLPTFGFTGKSVV